MKLQLDIGFDQLVQLARELPKAEWIKLKEEVEEGRTTASVSPNLETFLLTAPTFTKRQLNEVAKARKAISQWRKK